MVSKGKEFQIVFDILNTICCFSIGILMGVCAFLNKVINYSSEKIFIGWDYSMDKTNRKKIVKDMDNDQYAVNYFILFPPTFKCYFNLVVCKINKTDGLDNNQFKNIINYESSLFSSWYFLLLTRTLNCANEDKSNATVHKPGFYINSSSTELKDKIIINDPVWSIVLHYDLKNKGD